MARIVRHAGIALGSLVAAWLVVGVVGPWFLPFLGVSGGPPGNPDATPSGSVVVAIVTLVLGGLIYRDIVRREQPRP